MIARVILDIKHQEMNRLFDYLVPAKWEPFLSLGMRVVVPLGESKRMGYVVELVEESEFEVKEIIEVLDTIPTIEEETFYLADVMKKEYFHLENRVFNTIIPKELLVHYQKEVHFVDESKIPFEIKEFFNTKGVWSVRKKDLPFGNLLRRLNKNKIVEIKTVLRSKAKEKRIKVYHLTKTAFNRYLNRYPQLEHLELDRTYLREDLVEVGFSISNINTLVKHGVLFEKLKKVNRGVGVSQVEADRIVLTAEQQNAVDAVLSKKDVFQPFLLKGISGSGKTEVYFDLIEAIIKEGRQAMLLVPEIALIQPLYQRLSKRFDSISVFHSGMAAGERFDQYQMIKNKESKIIIGTRSAFFIPLDLGILILDEAHDESYVQKEGAYYDTRELALYKAKFHQVPVVFGTSTPTLEMMYSAEQGEYQKLELNQRPLFKKLPKMYFVDMKKELQENNTSIFSKILIEKINDRIAKKEQTMLFLNRKGYAPFVLCRTCGYVPKCPNCEIALTYYKNKKQLTCHYCGYHEGIIQACPSCQSDKVKEVGVGIEYVVNRLEKTFPDAKILRIDANVTKTKNSHEILYKKFETENIDILVGTQMVSKGLDFKNVTLVGFLMADLLFQIPHYFASEQAYILLMQACGRSGRHQQGEVIVQGYDLKESLEKNVEQGYDSFYKEALYQRKLGKYPPYNKVSQFIFEGTELLKTYQAAFQAKKDLSEKGVTVLGPIEPLYRKTRDRFTYLITFKYQVLNSEMIKRILKGQTANLYIQYIPSLMMM
ncbi:MAG: primosomal protein N' [Acholeplasmataceae bacterium]